MCHHAKEVDDVVVVIPIFNIVAMEKRNPPYIFAIAGEKDLMRRRQIPIGMERP